jgi:transcriptional regulator with XRE-family HTH domain
VAGLRRAEVAMLADVSVEYYSKLERGNIAGASDAVLHSIASALHLDDAERAHLFDLACAANAPTAKPRRRTAKSAPTRPGTATGSRRDHRRPGLRAQWQDGRPRREPPRQSVLRRCIRGPWTRELGTVRFPRFGTVQGLLPLMGCRCRRDRRDPAHGSGARPEQ